MTASACIIQCANKTKAQINIVFSGWFYPLDVHRPFTCVAWKFNIASEYYYWWMIEKWLIPGCQGKFLILYNRERNKNQLIKEIFFSKSRRMESIRFLSFLSFSSTMILALSSLPSKHKDRIIEKLFKIKHILFVYQNWLCQLTQIARCDCISLLRVWFVKEIKCMR